MFVVPGTIVWYRPGKQYDVRPMPQNFQIAFQSNTVIQTPTDAGVTISPVSPQTPPPSFAPGAMPTLVGATLPPLSLEELQSWIPQLQDGIVDSNPLLSQAILAALASSEILPPPSEAAVRMALAQQPPLGPPPPPRLAPLEHRIDRPVSPAR